MIRPRPAQEKILAYRSGTLGVLAVPGSGKTWTLSKLAADLIDRRYLAEGQEVLIVTLVNSAVENFTHRVNEFLSARARHLVPRYRVRTLHGLAHDIVRERPDLAGLSDDFQILDEREAEEIRSHVALTWLQGHPDSLDTYLNPDLEEGRYEWVRREPLPRLVREMAVGFIRLAKDRELTPERLQQLLDEVPLPLPLAEMGWAMYRDYQRALAYRGAVDFDDLIRLALQTLQADPDFLERLRQRWPFVLEDEAQDSSRLQEHILRLLTWPDGNWVRVGDPNQAIYESFTTANPRFLREFYQGAKFQHELPNSGRATHSLIALANYLVEWTRDAHPVEGVREALSLPHILPTPESDPQPNPPDSLSEIHLVERRYSPEDEIAAVADSLARWLPENPDHTVAVLTPRNNRAFQVAEALRSRGLEVVDGLLRSSPLTRHTAGALGNVLNYLSNPGSPARLAKVYQVWGRAARDDTEAWGRVLRTADLLGKCRQVEDFLWPRPGEDWLVQVGLHQDDPVAFAEVQDFRQALQRWQGTVLLPIDQMILTLAQDLFSEPAELAISHKLAVVLRRANATHSEWRLPELTDELVLVARNERRFLGFSQDELAFDPDKHRGKVVVATMHKAKGLEWDRVYLMAVNNYNFPDGTGSGSYFSEKWFIRDRLNLEAETLAQLEAVLGSDEYEWYQEGKATQEARIEFARERLRLLYVGITRARKALVVTWNTGRRGEQLPALPLVALQAWLAQGR